MRDESPTLVAETYLDAWRKQRFDLAMRVSRGRAHREARARHPSPSEAGSTRSMDTERLTYLVDETHYESETRIRLIGVAEGQVAGAPYRRRAEFTVERTQGAWRVSAMTLGERPKDASRTPQPHAP